MTPRAIVVRERAARDVERAIDWYRRNAGESTALRFVAAFEEALARMALHANAGSPRFAQELDLPGLRSMRIAGFPYVVFYADAAAHLDVWRVLHGARDLPALLQGDLGFRED